ncbi:universal stress protein [Halobaculum halobium]|uniref:universal stress protein n=1 Tax=Halobaculum halobium TaxID=3032281 RepID=UPI00360625AB
MTSIREGVPHEELLSYAEDQGVDLVVVGAKGRSAFQTVLLGSTTEAILRADQVPVLVVNSTDH